MRELKNIKLFLLDMDGTIYLDDKLFDKVPELLELIRKRGGRYLFLTNNSSKSVDKYVEKLASLGINSTEDDFLTSVNATALYLKNKGYKKIYALGTKAFREQLSDEGLNVTDSLSDGIDCLCLGFDTELSFKKLEDACILLGRGVDYVATNPDWVCPTWYGSVPDCGALAQMLFHSAGRMPRVIGKPQPEMVYLAMEKTSTAPDQTVIIGDRLYTDIACGVNAGVGTLFVLSGEGTVDDIEKTGVKPRWVLNNVAELYDILSE